jgi:peptidoglycan/xylan/chitin deacetylase (PgdA/CDA1 family)
MRDIGDAQQAIADVTGVMPRFFRPPFGVRTPLTEPVLARLGIHCVGWNVRSYDTVDTDGERVARRVIGRMRPGSIVLLHDCGCVRAPPSVLGALPRVLEAIAAGGSRPVTLRQALA